MYHFNKFILGIWGVIWGTTILFSCNRPHTTQMDEPTTHSLEADIHQSNNEEATDLHIAVRKGDAVAVNTLLSQVPETHRLTLIQQKNNTERTALHDAAINSHAAVVNILLEHIPEADRPALIRQQDNDGDTVLHMAAWGGNEAIFNTLLNFFFFVVCLLFFLFLCFLGFSFFLVV